MTKRDIFYIAIIILIIIFWKGCGSPSQVTNSTSFDLKHYSDSLAADARRQEHERDILLGIINGKTDTLKKVIHHWHTSRHDSLIPCETKLLICDTLVLNDSILQAEKDTVIAKDTRLLKQYKKVRTADSTNIELLTPRQYLLLGGDVTSGGNVFPSIGFDTRKGVFMAGYDPFNKQFKVGGYFKVKLWKRRK